MLLCDVGCLLDLSICLTYSAQQIKSLTFLVTCLCFVDHVQLNCYHSQLGLKLFLFLCLSYASCSSREFHVPDTDFSHVHSLTLDTHDGHFLPNCWILNVFNTLVSLIQISRCQIKWKVQNWVLNNIVIMIDSLEIMKSSLLNCDIFTASFDWVKVRYSQSKNVQNTWFKKVFILVLDSSLCCVKEC